MMIRLPLILIALIGPCGLPVPAAEFEVLVSPRVTIVARAGITGGGHPVHAGDRTLILYPNHRDDFGGSFGTGSAHSEDGGLTWRQGSDDWPLPKMIDLWADRLGNGELLAMGIHWVPDPAKRRDATPPKVPSNAYQIAVSKDRGLTWIPERAVIDCPPEIGVIARPLPHIVATKNGTLLMPAYSWSRRGNRAVLLQSEDQGRRWEVRSVITTAVAIIKSGVPVSTPWLESSVSFTKDGDLLAIVRTGSRATASLVSVRSADGGRTWEPPEKLPFAGKLPTLSLLRNGVLTLVTALSRNHCRLYLSGDGTGRSWSNANVISSLTGGNVGVSVTGPNRLIIATPANRRIDAWNVRINRPAEMSSRLQPPTDIVMRKGILSWTGSPGASAYRISPVLVRRGPAFSQTEILPYATTRTPDAKPRVELGRQLLPGSTYAFEIEAVDSQGKISVSTRSRDIQL
jgi:hypothetical protein